MAYHNEMTRVQIPALVHLTRLGYTYVSIKKRLKEFDVQTNIHTTVFKSQFLRLNENATAADFDRVLANIKMQLDENNLGKNFYMELIDKGDLAYKLIDWEEADNNTYTVVTELENINDEDSFRPDITVFINGLPLVFVEVKQPNAIRDGVTGIVSEAKRTTLRLQNPKFKKFNNITQFMIFSDNQPNVLEAGVPLQGAYYTAPSVSSVKFNVFRESHPGQLNDLLKPINEQTVKEILSDVNKQIMFTSPEFKSNLSEGTPTNQILTSLLTKTRLLTLLRYGIAYVQKIDNTTQQTIYEKHIMRYPQFFAMNAIQEKLESNVKKGVIWHTQGSGKTALTYYTVNFLRDYFQSKNIISHFYFIVDRIDLANQAQKEFEKRGMLVSRINSKEQLSEQFDGDIAVVNIQKFKDDTDFTQQSVYDTNDQNIYFIDEAHRSYNPKGSYLANLYNADESAIKIALTGTPLIMYKEHQGDDVVDKADLKTTRNIFGDYIHKYYYDQSIEDGFTLRLIREAIETEYKEKIGITLRDLQIKERTLNKKQIYAHPKFVAPMLDYILTDLTRFRLMNGDFSLGAMVVADSSEQARELFKQFNELQESRIIRKTDMPSMVAEPTIIYQTEKPLNAALILHDEDDKETRDNAVTEFKEGKIDVLFVYSMLLTGFDAPRLKKLYLGRKIKAHNLLQALTRVNRPYKTYSKGYVVDFADITSEFEETNQAYFRELSKEYDTGITGEEVHNVFGSLFVSAQEINRKIEAAQHLLVDYTTDNLELFSQEISIETEKAELQRLKTALNDIKENYNVARLLGYRELLDNIDIVLFNRLLTMVTQRITTMNLLENVNNEDSEQLLNLAMVEAEFIFVKTGEAELQLAANDVKEVTRKAATGLKNNWDKKDPKYITLLEEFKRVMNQQNNRENPTMIDLQNWQHQYDDIINQINKLNRENQALANKFNGDTKYARTFKRFGGRKPSDHYELFQILQTTKKGIDHIVENNQDVMKNASYFMGEIRPIVKKAWDEMDTKKVITPEILMQISNITNDEYQKEYQQL